MSIFIHSWFPPAGRPMIKKPCPMLRFKSKLVLYMDSSDNDFARTPLARVLQRANGRNNCLEIPHTPCWTDTELCVVTAER